MRIVTLLVPFLYATLSQAQSFPQLTGETANGEVVVLPSKAAKSWTLIGLAYSQRAEPLLEEWYQPAYLRFIAKHGLMAGSYEADVYFVPLFVGMNKAAYEPSMKKFRKSAEPEIVDHVLFSKDELDPLKAALDLGEKDIPYFFVLNSEGTIVHRTKGDFTEEKLEAIEEVMME